MSDERFREHSHKPMRLAATGGTFHRTNAHGRNTLIAGLAGSTVNMGFSNPFATSAIALSNERARPQQASLAPMPLATSS
jgi:hypothetical protein